MVTANTRETETSTAASAVAVERAAPVNGAVIDISADVVDISAVPETPAELLKQWDVPAPRRPLIHAVVSATLVRLWEGITGPGMTQEQRLNRDIAEHSGYARTFGRNL